MNKIICTVILFFVFTKTVSCQQVFSYKVIDGNQKGLFFEKTEGVWRNKTLKMNFEEIKTNNPYEIILRNVEANILFKLTKGEILICRDNISDINNCYFEYSGHGNFGSTLPNNISVKNKHIRYDEFVDLTTDETGFLEPGDKWIWTTNNCDSFPCDILSNNLKIRIQPQLTTTYFLSTEKNIKKNNYLQVTINVDTLTIAPNEIDGPAFICNNEKVVLKINGGSLGKNAEWAWFDNAELKNPFYLGKKNSVEIIAKENTKYYVVGYKKGIADSRPVTYVLNVQTKSILSSLTTPSAFCIKDGVSLDISNLNLGNYSNWHWYFGDTLNPIEQKQSSDNYLALNSYDLLKFSQGKHSVNVYLRSESECFKSPYVSTVLNFSDAGYQLANLVIKDNYNEENSRLTLSPYFDNKPASFYTNNGVKLTYQWYNKKKNKLIAETETLLDYKVKSTTTFSLKITSQCGSYRKEYLFKEIEDNINVNSSINNSSTQSSSTKKNTGTNKTENEQSLNNNEVTKKEKLRQQAEFKAGKRNALKEYKYKKIYSVGIGACLPFVGLPITLIDAFVAPNDYLKQAPSNMSDEFYEGYKKGAKIKKNKKIWAQNLLGTGLVFALIIALL
jgi:hypothetical protein